MKTDIEIAHAAQMLSINDIAAQLDVSPDYLEHYGKYKAKFAENLWPKIAQRPPGKLVLVTAINPTPAGEGKTTITVGLGQALKRLGKNAAIALREPSLGPCFGIKGGAAGGGYAQAVPMEDLNLHFTGDFHAVTAANNLLAALLDNHLHQGNSLNINPKQIVLKRCLDMNDRALRHLVVGLGGPNDGVIREERFMITVASEVMAILCLARDLGDLKARLARIIVGWNFAGEPVTAGALGATGAMTVLLKDAFKPNLVQTLENTPVLVHGGPFANIAHGCNSVRATQLALRLADIVVTEAGFGADLGAEKFFNIKCRTSGMTPDAVVLVATTRALKYNGGVTKQELDQPNLAALQQGMANLGRHIDNLQKFGLPVTVALNTYASDTPAEHALIKEYCQQRGCRFALADVWAQGGRGGEALAHEVMAMLEQDSSHFQFLYPDTLSLEEKIRCIAREIYGAADIELSAAARSALDKPTASGFGTLPVCMAKTPYSFSDNPAALGCPAGFILHIRELYVSAGAGFVVALTGNVMTMPGLPRHPAALNMDVDDDGIIRGLS